MRFVAFGAASIEEAKAHVAKRLGSYFAQGTDVFEGLPPEDTEHNDVNNVINFLVSERQLDELREWETKLDCHVDIDLSVHYNYS